jgi:hypothetical protein
MNLKDINEIDNFAYFNSYLINLILFFYFDLLNKK